MSRGYMHTWVPFVIFLIKIRQVNNNNADVFLPPKVQCIVIIADLQHSIREYYSIPNNETLNSTSFKAHKNVA